MEVRGKGIGRQGEMGEDTGSSALSRDPQSKHHKKQLKWVQEQRSI